MSFVVVLSSISRLKVTAAPLAAPPLAAVVAVGAAPEPEAVVAVGAAPEPEAVVAVGAALPLELEAGVGVSLAPPHAESIMARASVSGTTCRLIRLVIFIAVLFLLGY
jgi:hypothetical protein